MNLQNFALVAALTSFAAFFNQIKAFAMSFLQFFIRTDTIHGRSLGQELVKTLLKDSKVYRWGNRQIVRHWAYIKNIKTHDDTFMLYEKRLIILYKNRIPILLQKEGTSTYSLMYLLGTVNISALIDSVAGEQLVMRYQRHETPKTTGFNITDLHGDDSQRNNGGGATLSTPDSLTSSPSDLSESDMSIHFTPNELEKQSKLFGLTVNDIITDSSLIPVKQQYYWSAEATKLSDEVNFWLKSRQWFRDRGLTWKRSAMLTGQPGTGKSKLILEVAKKFNLPVYRLNIGNMSSKEFVDFYTQSINQLGSIILIEDIDAVFNGRENVLATDCQHKQLLSFDVLINTLGGIKENNGAFTIITTNHPEKLDPALIRPGRFDIKLEILPLDLEGRRFIAQNILGDWPELVDQMVVKNPDCPAANFENKCVELAISKFWTEKSLK